MKILVAFDVDNTLIVHNDAPVLACKYCVCHNNVMSSWGCKCCRLSETGNLKVVNVLKALAEFDNIDVMVWSGGGKAYAELWGRRLGLPDKVTYSAKTTLIRPDMAFDDMETFSNADRVVII